MKRGEVWWADLPAPAGRRLVVLLSRDAAYAVRTAVTVAPVTRTVRGIPVEVALDRDDGLREACVVSLDDITTIPKKLLTRRVSALSRDRLAETRLRSASHSTSADPRLAVNLTASDTAPA